MKVDSICALLLLVFAALMLLVGIFRGDSSYAQFLELQQSRVVLENVVTSLRHQNQELLTEISKIKESPDYARKVYRDKYHLVEEGESIVFFAN